MRFILHVVICYTFSDDRMMYRLRSDSTTSYFPKSGSSTKNSMKNSMNDSMTSFPKSGSSMMNFSKSLTMKLTP